MATSKEYMEFLMEQLSALDGIYYRRMMGEYLIYYKDKVAACICDERFLVRPVPNAIKMLPSAEYDAMTEGGRKKLLRVDDIDNRELLTNLFIAIYDELPVPKPKKRRKTMPKLIIIRGNSGSGKTTLAKELQHKIGRNTLVISQDIVRREMLYAKDGADTVALPLLINLVNYGYNNCSYVILEGILYSDWYNPLFEYAKEIFCNNIFAYYYDIPFEETLKRHATKQGELSFGAEDMKRWWREKDFIKIIREKTLNKNTSLDDALGIIMNDIGINC